MEPLRGSALYHIGDVRNVQVSADIFRGNYPDTVQDGYDVYYRISFVNKIASLLNIATAGKSIGRLVSEIAYDRYGNPSMKMKDGVIEGVKKLEGVLERSDGLSGIRFRIIITYEKLERCSNFLGEYKGWVKKRIPSEIYENGNFMFYFPNNPHDMRKMVEDIKKALIDFPQTVQF